MKFLKLYTKFGMCAYVFFSEVRIYSYHQTVKKHLQPH